VSLLSLHAGALEFRPDSSPEDVARAAGVIRSAAHDALQELRDVVGVLRDDGAGGALEPPQPTIGDIPRLIEQFREAGVRIECDPIPETTEARDSAIERTAYRIVQEGLANASKHAPGSDVAVALKYDASGGLIVRVESRLSRISLGSTEFDRAAVSLATSGVGLVGLGERVELAGGQLQYGPTAHGDFELVATLPFAA
jgi:signal transduction histidine kinase